MADRIARIWNGSNWEIITSTAAAPTAVVNYQSAAPSGQVTGQVWVDSDTDQFYVWDGSSWVQASTDLSSYLTISSASSTYAPISSPSFTGTINAENISLSGLLTVSETAEALSTGTVSASVFTANFSTSALFYITTAPSSNFTINVTNLPTTDNRVTVLSFFVIQGSTGYIPNALQIGGASQTIKWSGGSAPTPTNGAGKVDVFTFTFIRRSSTWEVLGTSDTNY